MVKTTKKSTKSPSSPGYNSEIDKKINKVMKDVGALVKKAKTKYSDLDPKTKKKIAVGIASLGALLAGTAMIKKKKK